MTASLYKWAGRQIADRRWANGRGESRGRWYRITIKLCRRLWADIGKLVYCRAGNSHHPAVVDIGKALI